MEEILGTALVGMLTIGPLVWRNFTDRRQDRAQAVHARLHASLRALFGGEPLLSIEVRPPMPWRAGRVVLWAPAGWEWVIEKAWDILIAEVPAEYELVVKPAGRAAPRPRPLAPVVRHA